MLLAPSTAAVLDAAARRALRYLDQLTSRGVAPTPEALERLSALGGELPDSGRDAAEMIALLDEVGSPATTASAGPRVTGGWRE
jgi:hypothetical protein